MATKVKYFSTAMQLFTYILRIPTRLLVYFIDICVLFILYPHAMQIMENHIFIHVKVYDCSQ